MEDLKSLKDELTKPCQASSRMVIRIRSRLQAACHGPNMVQQPPTLSFSPMQAMSKRTTFGVRSWIS